MPIHSDPSLKGIWIPSTLWILLPSVPDHLSYLEESTGKVHDTQIISATNSYNTDPVEFESMLRHLSICHKKDGPKVCLNSGMRRPSRKKNQRKIQIDRTPDR